MRSPPDYHKVMFLTVVLILYNASGDFGSAHKNNRPSIAKPEESSPSSVSWREQLLLKFKSLTTNRFILHTFIESTFRILSKYYS